MAKAQILLTELNEERPNKSLSEINLAFLRKLAKKLTPNNQNLTDIGQVLAVKIIGHLNLAQRNVLPRQFNKSELSKALFKYFRESYFGDCEPEDYDSDDGIVEDNYGDEYHPEEWEKGTVKYAVRW